MELFSALGLDLKIFIAQLVNFIVLGFILYKIGYQPILKFVKDRTAKIEQGVKEAASAKEALANAQTEQERIIAEAKAEANAILEQAKQQATKQGDQIIERTKSEAQKVLEKARHDIRQEHEKMLAEAQGQLAAVVLMATEKLLHTKMDTPADQALIEKTLETIKR